MRIKIKMKMKILVVNKKFIRHKANSDKNSFIKTIYHQY